MRRSTVRPLAIVAAFVLGGCGYKPAATSATGTAGSHAGGTGGGSGGRGGAGGSGGGRGGTGGSTPIIFLDGGSDTTGTSPDSNCGARSKTATKVAPDILILLDRSGSMNDNISSQMCLPDGGGIGGPATGCGAASKWALTVPAITQVVSETDADVNWGLKFFPDNAAGVCNVSSTNAVDVGPGNSAAIATAIMGATSANGGVVGYNGTPTRAATSAAATYLATLADKSPKFILLATDGIPTCSAAGTGGATGGASADDTAGAVSAVTAAHTAGFPTFVVGIATGGGAADTTLGNMAKAGGLAQAGTPSYYPVTSLTELAAAIRTLIGATATCTFQIGPAPTDDGTTDLNHISVFGDGVEITRDQTKANGYDYVDASMQSIEVHGPLCDQIMSGAIRNVTVTFRCLVP
jgi:hypothetical protein